ncbi:ABC-2 type transport system permease protein [Chitinophaga costaii]|uniref:ABC-2 type transport system permease protein n=1 Tax=Chitinophaga costaii TaxID=1335309 RepID=A0A1C4FNA1_9BACT|nr:ABC transporter permease [Chitinophaga costaii]PUZ29947.1 ABC transporter permease [Chitinophaga costaii]SCC57011.1 ABC-2 type transport system permease protein [Chitinophaga costaii]
MQKNIPKTATVLAFLLQADFTTQWRNRRSFILVLLVPVIILFTWKSAIDKIGAAFAFSTAISIGLVAIGLMGYPNSIARDREKGVFQRLRVAPVPRWSIMGSRLVVQLAMILLVTLCVYAGGYYFDHITISPAGYVITIFTALLGGAVYLSIGQLIVGLIKNPETVNSTARLIYFLFIMVGILGDLGVLGVQIKQLINWSPYGVVKAILAGGMDHAKWNKDTTMALAATLGYTMVFATIGIRKFKWSAK